MKINPQSILNEVTIQYERTSIENTKITSSRDSAEVLRKLNPVPLDHREYFMALFLDRANVTIGFFLASIGGMNGTVADGKIIFQSALKCNSASMILCHNHPSGSLKPSQSDLNLTKNLVEFGTLIELPILDHIILTSENYYSFADEGRI